MKQLTTQQLLIRISDNSLSFAMNLGGEEGICFEPYEVKSGISMAANLREAFKTSDLLRRACQKATVILDSPTMLVPLEDFQAEEMEQQFRFVYPSCEDKSIEMSVIPAVKNMAIYAISKDLKNVLNDHFEEVRIKPLMASVWDFFLKRSFGSNSKKLYAYFHDGKVELCSFNRTRVAFANCFEAENIPNSLYFILGAWKQIGGQAMMDDLYLSGKIDEREELTEELKQFLARVFYINPSADFNRAPATQILNFPLDMILQFV